MITSEAHNSEVSDVAFSPDGSRLYRASVDGTARTYLLDIDELMVLAHQRLYRQLKDSECRQYLHREFYPGP